MRLLVPCALALLLTATATAASPEAGDGHVAAYAAGSLGDPHAAVSLRALPSGKTFQLKPQSLGSPLLSARLPAGSYQLLQSDRDKAVDGATLEVKAGQVTELGALKRFDVGGHRQVLLSFDHPEAQRALAAWRPEGVSGLHLSWRHGQVPASVEASGPSHELGLLVTLLAAYEREHNRPALKKQLAAARVPAELLALARRAAAPTLDELTSAAGDTLLIGGDFGQLLERLPSGEWRNVDTGTVAALSAVWLAPSGRLVGGTDGQIRAEQADGQWRTLHTLPAGERVMDLDRLGQRWFVLGARGPSIDAYGGRMLQSVTLYSGVADDFSDLKPIRQHQKPVAMAPANVIRGQALGGQYVVNLGTEFGRLDPETGAWQALKPGHLVTHFRAHAASGRLTAFMAAGAGSKLSVSDDGGSSWKALETPPYTVNEVQLTGPAGGRAARWSAGFWSANLEFLAFDGQRWQKQFELEPQACRRTLKSEDGQHWFCVSGGGSILRADATGLKLEAAIE